MHKKKHRLKWSSTNLEYKVVIYQIYRMGCPFCESRISGGFKHYNHWVTCATPWKYKTNKSWKSYRKHQYR